MKYLFLMLIAFGAVAAPISEHNEQHAAEMAAQNKLFDNGCTRTQITRIERFAVFEENGKYYIRGNGLRVECVKFQGVAKYSLSWAAPVEREDGQPLPAQEIDGYLISKDGEFVDFVTCCEFITENLEGVQIQTVDKNGLTSRAVGFGG